MHSYYQSYNTHMCSLWVCTHLWFPFSAPPPVGLYVFNFLWLHDLLTFKDICSGSLSLSHSQLLCHLDNLKSDPGRPWLTPGDLNCPWLTPSDPHWPWVTWLAPSYLTEPIWPSWPKCNRLTMLTPGEPGWPWLTPTYLADPSSPHLTRADPSWPRLTPN